MARNSPSYTYTTGSAISGFNTIALSGQSAGTALGADVIADSGSDTLTLSAGPYIALLSDPVTDTVTISSVAGGSGGGGGGFRTNVSGDPKAGGSLSIGKGTYPITVGEGGASNPTPGPAKPGLPGGNSIFSTITAAGGGGARMHDGNPSPVGDGEGGSGGGISNPTNSPTYGNGNVPSVSPPQGNDGGYASVQSSEDQAGDGGNGHPIAAFAYPLISPGIPSPMQPTFGPACGPTGLYAGGGGGGNWSTGYSYAGAGGGGAGSAGGDATDGSASSGEGGPGGGGDGANAPGTAGSGINGCGGGGGGHPLTPGAGGDGIVIIRYAV